MRTMVFALMFFFLCVGTSMAASWTGWISDAKCGLKGNNRAHSECAKSCIKAGVKPVFVTDSGQLLNVANPESVMQCAGERVLITGSEGDGKVKVEKVQVIKPFGQ